MGDIQRFSGFFAGIIFLMVMTVDNFGEIH